MAAHDQIRAVVTDLSRLSIEAAGLDKLMRRSLVPTTFNLDEVSYLPVPVTYIVDLAAAVRVAMDLETAQRVIGRFWLNRMQKYGTKALFNIDEQQVANELRAYADVLNSTWQAAIITVELKTGLVALFDLTVRPGGDAFKKKVSWSLYLTVPDNVEKYRRFGELDERDGTVNLLRHAETEAVLVTSEDEKAAPGMLAAMMAWRLVSSYNVAGKPRLDPLPEGLDLDAIGDCRYDLEDLYNRLAAVDMGRLPSDCGAHIEVTNWRQ